MHSPGNKSPQVFALALGLLITESGTQDVRKVEGSICLVILKLGIAVENPVVRPF